MSQTIVINGVTRTDIRRESVEIGENAYLGEPGEGSFVIDDATGGVVIPAYKPFTVEQDASTLQPRIGTGFTNTWRISRGSSKRGTARHITVTTTDLNDLLERLSIGDDGDREAESIGDRITWLLSSGYLAAFDFGRVTYPTEMMDADNYKSRYPRDVLAACAMPVKFNFYLRRNHYEDAVELVFRDDNASTDDECTLWISNDLDDIAAGALAPLVEPVLTGDAEHIYSGVRYNYNKASGYATRPATATAYAERDGVTEDSGTKSGTVAADIAVAFLYESRAEEQLLPLRVRVPIDQAGLIEAGMRIPVRMLHMTPEGWNPARYARILRLKRTQPVNTDDEGYELALDLSPCEGPDPIAFCSEDYENTPSDTYYPLGSLTPGTSGDPNGSDGVVYYHRGGFSLPDTPTPGWVGGWHFPNWGAGGIGTIDYGGSCVENSLYFMTVGNGTWTIQTEAGGTARSLGVSVGPYGGLVGLTTIAPGDSVEVVIDDATTGDCIRFVQIIDVSGTCGDYWGWSSAIWVAV